jgi:hypothetical protein
MAYLFLSDPVLHALDDDGTPLAGAKLYLYATGGLVNQDAYTTSALNVAHAQPVVADAYGRFAAIYFDRSLSYRAILKDSGGTTVWDRDPINPAGLGVVTADIADSAITAAKLAATAITDKLGFTGILNKAGDTMTGPLRLDSTPASVNDDQAGYIGTPTATKTDNYTLTLQDAGWMLRMNSASAKSITVPTNASVGLPIGTMIGVRNIGAGVCTIASSAPVSVKALGSGTADTAWDIAQYGEVWIRKDDTDTWYIGGVGYS